MKKNDILKFDEGIVDYYLEPWRGKRRSKLEKQTVVYEGGGFRDVLEASTPLERGAEILKMLPEFSETAQDLAFGPIGTSFSNSLSERFNENPNWRPGFAGEKHLVVPTKNIKNDKGKSSLLTRANYLGPGTNLKERLERGDVGVDETPENRGVDGAAKIHDISYAKAKNYRDIVRADKQFIKDVIDSNQDPFTKQSIIKAMQAKNIGEKIGLLSKDRYLTDEQKESFKKQEKGQDGSGYRFKVVRDTRKDSKLKPAEEMMKRFKEDQKKVKKKVKKAKKKIKKLISKS